MRQFCFLIAITAALAESSSPSPPRTFTPYIFSANANKTVSIGAFTFESSEGSLTWPKYPNINPSFVVIQSLLSSQEISHIMELLEGDLDLDEDPDSVDNLATHEIYLQRNGKIDGVREIEGKLDQFSSVYKQRLPFRERFNQLIQPVIDERILPFVNEHYADSCGISGQRCYVCHSLVRRYQSEERMTHPAHFDTHALVTGVIALNSYGKDYHGGIYVSVGVDPTKEINEQYIGLQAGDALFHQSNLLHGVRVENGTRWSWIIWIKDTESCTDDSLHWTHAKALSGTDPIAQYIHSKRSSLKDKIFWLNESTKLGFSLAANELGLLLSTGNIELQIEQNLLEAKKLFLFAAEENVPEAFFNLGMMSLTAEKNPNPKSIAEAVEYFKRAVAIGELSKAAQNVGVAYFHGRSVPKNLTAAVEWWERAGNGDSLMKAAQTLLSQSSTGPGAVDFVKVLSLLRRSANTGHSPAALYLGRYHDSIGERGEAIRWLMKAARQGNEEAREYLTRIQRQQRQQAADAEDLWEEEDESEDEEREEGKEQDL